MNSTAANIAHDTRQLPADDGRPRFLDDAYNAHTEELADWWLDLGCVDLPVGNR